jgi:DNA-binding MurR/RpiR family transcriptional regulator
MLNNVGLINMKNTSLSNLIKNKISEFTPKQKILANYILSNTKEAAFMKVKSLAKNAGVSDPTVTRFIIALGYKKYSAFQKELQKLVQVKLSSIERFNLNKYSKPEDDFIHNVFMNEIKIVNNLYESLEPAVFYKIVKILSSKKKVIVSGLQASVCLAKYLAYNLNKVRDNIFPITSIDENVLNQLDAFKDDSVALIFCFPRYPRRTLEFVDALEKLKIPIISVTDGIISPISERSLEKIYIPIVKEIFIDQFAAAMCIINALVLGVAQSNSNRTKKTLEHLEEVLNNNKIYLNN